MISSLPADDGTFNKMNNDLSFHFSDDLVSQVLGQQQTDMIVNNTNNGYTSYDLNFTGDLWKQPDKVAGGIGGLTSFIDVVDTIWGTIKLLFNIAMSPLTLFFNYRMPILIGLMIGVPYAVIFVLGLIWFIRGMPS